MKQGSSDLELESFFKEKRKGNRDWFNIEIPLTLYKRGTFKAFKGSQIIVVDLAHRVLNTQYTSNKINFEYYASMEQIAEYANCSKKTASTYTNVLMRMGLLERTFLGSNKNDKKSAYRLVALRNDVLNNAKDVAVIEAKKLFKTCMKPNIINIKKILEKDEAGEIDFEKNTFLKKVPDFEAIDHKNRGAVVAKFYNSMTPEEKKKTINLN
jgi:hypothetical protein